MVDSCYKYDCLFVNFYSFNKRELCTYNWGNHPLWYSFDNNGNYNKAEGNVKITAKEFDRTLKHPKDIELKNYNIAGFEYIVNANEMAIIQTTFKLKKSN